MTQLLLVSVVHLQSDWQHRFDVALTKSRPFYTAAGPVEVPMMRIHAAFRVANLAECKCRVLELPYAVSDGPNNRFIGQSSDAENFFFEKCGIVIFLHTYFDQAYGL